MSNTRDITVLRHMARYCDEIADAVKQGELTQELHTNPLYRNAVAMGILQIGELTTHLSDEFKAEYNQMPWQDIKGMRNVAAHHYGSIDSKMLWATAGEDIPELKRYCEDIIQQHEYVQQEGIAPDEYDLSQQMY